MVIKYTTAKMQLIGIRNLKYIKEELCDDLEDDMKVDGAYRELCVYNERNWSHYFLY
jgi:hypothetical protein